MAAGTLKAKKELIVMVLVVLLIVIGLVMIYLQISKINDLRASIEDEELALAEARAVLARRLEYQANEPYYRELARTLELMMPATPQEEEILRYFGFLSEEYDLDLQQISFAERVDNEEQGYIKMPLSISLEGRFKNLIAFLSHLYSLGERAIRVDSINITLSPRPDSPANLRVTISAVAFHSAN